MCFKFQLFIFIYLAHQDFEIGYNKLNLKKIIGIFRIQKKMQRVKLMRSNSII